MLRKQPARLPEPPPDLGGWLGLEPGEDGNRTSPACWPAATEAEAIMPVTGYLPPTTGEGKTSLCLTKM